MRRIIYFLFLLSWFFVLPACSTFSVSPASQSLVWKNGRGFSTVSDKNAKMIAALTYQSQTTLRFYVKIKNHGNGPFLVSSNDFQLQGDGLENGAAAANDPESIIAADNQEIQNNRQEVGLSDMSITADSASSFASDLDNDSKEQKGELRQEREDNLDHDTAVRNVQFYTQEKSEVESKYLRKTTLEPGKTVQGIVEFPVSLQKGPIRLVFNAGESNLTIGYLSTKQ